MSLGVWGFAAKEYDIVTYRVNVKEMQYTHAIREFIAYTIIMTIQTHCQSFYLVASAKSCIFRVVVGG